MPTGTLTISQYTASPTAQIDSGSLLEVRGWYSRDFISVDGVTPIFGSTSSGEQGPYFSTTPTLNGSGDLVVPAHVVQITVGANPTANYFEGLWIDGAFSQLLMPNTQGATGWQIPSVYGDPIAYDEIATYNRAKRLVYAPATYFTADETIAEIRRLAGNFNYMAVGVNGIGQASWPPVVASAPQVLMENDPKVGSYLNIIAYFAAITNTAAQNTVAIGNAVTAAAAVGAGLYIPVGTFAVNTMSITVPVQFAPGSSILAPAAGQTLTLTKDITAGASQHFGVAGSVVLPKLSRTLPQWFGANNGGSVDNLAAFNATIAAMPSGIFDLTIPGTYQLSDSWVINKSNITVLTAPGVVIRTTTNTSGGETMVFRGTPVSNVLTNVHVTGGGTVTNTTPAAVHSNGIAFTSCRGWSVTGMRVVDVSRWGITAQEEVFDGLIADNYVDGADYAGIGVLELSPTTTIQLRNIKILNNTVTNTGTGSGAGADAGFAGIAVAGVDDLIITGNIVDTVLGNATHGRGINVQNASLGSGLNNRVTIANNQVTDTAGVGYFVFGAVNLNMGLNITESADSHGIYIEASTDVLLSGNQSLSAAARGITLVEVVGPARLNGDAVKNSGEDGIYITNDSSNLTTLQVSATVDNANTSVGAHDAVYIQNAPVNNLINVNVLSGTNRYAVNNVGATTLLISGNVSPGTTASFNGLYVNNGVAIFGVPQPLNWIVQTSGFSRVSTQFDKTSDTVNQNIPGLTATLLAGKTYDFEAILYTSSDVGGGVKFAIAGTATAAAIRYEAIVYNAAAIAAQTRTTALTNSVGGVTAVTVAQARITGTITVNGAGTLTVQFAQNASNVTASSVLVGSILMVWQVG